MPESMTNQDAIKYLLYMKHDVQAKSPMDIALDTAIEALKQPTIEAEPVRKPEMSEADRKKCEEWCKDCEHIEMCAWYPFGGCDFRLLPKPEQEVSEDAPD